MNATTIRSQIKNAGIDTAEIIIRKEYHGYDIRLNNSGLSLNHKMDGVQATEKKNAERATLSKIAEVTGGEVVGWAVLVQA